MKKLLIVFLGMLLTSILSAQSANWWRYPTYDHGGLKIGNTVEQTGVNLGNSDLIKIDSLTADDPDTPTEFKVYSGSTQLNPNIPAAFQIDASTVFTKLLADTVAITAGDTIMATWSGKRVYCTFSARDTIFIPTYASVPFSKEATIYFFMEGDGILFFSGLLGTNVEAPLDSMNLNTKGDGCALIYRDNDKWKLIGTKE